VARCFVSMRTCLGGPTIPPVFVEGMRIEASRRGKGLVLSALTSSGQCALFSPLLGHLVPGPLPLVPLLFFLEPGGERPDSFRGGPPILFLFSCNPFFTGEPTRGSVARRSEGLEGFWGFSFPYKLSFFFPRCGAVVWPRGRE